MLYACKGQDATDFEMPAHRSTMPQIIMNTSSRHIIMMPD